MQVFHPQLSHFALQALAGTALAALICLVSLRLRLLSPSGAVAAFVVGATIFALGGWRCALPLLAFFATSNAWGRWRRAKKQRMALEKGGPRDAWQVLANGALPALAVALAAIFPHQSPRLALFFAAAIAEANADTWATEIGAGASEVPRLITTFARVPAGRSGAVSATGTVAAAFGALLIGLSAIPLFSPDFRAAGFGIVSLAGFFGALLDSLFGATIQAEESGDPARRGIPWVGNDLVNFLASALAGLAAFAIGAHSP